MASAFNMGDLLGALESTSSKMEVAIKEVMIDLKRQHRVSGLSKREKAIEDEITTVERNLKIATQKLDRTGRIIRRDGQDASDATKQDFDRINNEIGALHVELNRLLEELKRISTEAARERNELKREQNIIHRQEQAEERQRKLAQKKFNSKLNSVIGMLGAMPTNYKPVQNNRLWRERSKSRSRSRSSSRNRHRSNKAKPRNRSSSPRRRPSGGATRRRHGKRKVTRRR